MSKVQQSMRDRVRARAEKHKNQSGMDTVILPEGVTFLKAEKGSSEFDILPYRVSVDTHPEVKKGELWYERSYLAHRNVGPEEKAIVCPRTMGKRCPICEEYTRLNKDPDADEEIVKGLRAKERELFNVVAKDGDGSVMILDISVHLFGLLLEQEILEGDESNASFAELKGGKTLKVRWEEKKMGKNKFFEAARIDFLDRDDLEEDVLDVVVDLDKALKILSYEEIEKMFQAGGEETGEPSSKEEPAEEEEKPTPRRVIGGNRNKPAEKPAEEEEDNLDMGDKPAKKTHPEVDEENAPAGDNQCIACDGTGKTSKGKVCSICNGTGVNEEVPSEEEEEPAPKKKPAKPPVEEEETEEEKPVRAN